MTWAARGSSLRRFLDISSTKHQPEPNTGETNVHHHQPQGARSVRHPCRRRRRGHWFGCDLHLDHRVQRITVDGRARSSTSTPRTVPPWPSTTSSPATRRPARSTIANTGSLDSTLEARGDQSSDRRPSSALQLTISGRTASTGSTAPRTPTTPPPITVAGLLDADKVDANGDPVDDDIRHLPSRGHGLDEDTDTAPSPTNVDQGKSADAELVTDPDRDVDAEQSASTEVDAAEPRLRPS